MAVARPHLAAGQPETGAVIGINGHHGCRITPKTLPLPIFQRPRRSSGVVENLISLLSWIAST